MNEFGEYLAHYGIKGQKKGIRRYQYEDGSLTPEGKERYGIKGNKKYYEYSKVKSAYGPFHIKSEKRLKKGGVGTVYCRGEGYYNMGQGYYAPVDEHGREQTNLPHSISMIRPILKSNSKDIVLERSTFRFSNRKEMVGFLRKPAKYLVTKSDDETLYLTRSKEKSGYEYLREEKTYDVISKKSLNEPYPILGPTR